MPSKSNTDSYIITKTRIYHLDNLRAIAIIMVVGVHTLSYCIPFPSLQFKLASFILSTVAVPVFFLVDGYLYAFSIQKYSTYRYESYIRKSFIRLVIPWIIFTLIYTLLRYIFESNGFLENKLIIGHSLGNIIISAYGSVYSAQLYFLLSLFVVRLITPILNLSFIKTNYHIALIFFTIFLSGYHFTFPFIQSHLYIEGGQEPLTHAIWGIQFYILGIIIFRATLITDIRKLSVVFVILFFTSLFIQISFYKINMGVIQYLYLLTLFFIISSIDKKYSALGLIGKQTMGIYLIHVPVVIKIVSLILNKFIHAPILSFTSILITTIFLSTIITVTINHIPYACIIFGTPYKNNRKNSL